MSGKSTVKMRAAEGPRKSKKICKHVNGCCNSDGAQPSICIGLRRNVVGLFLIMIMNIFVFTLLYFFPPTDIYF